MNLKSIYILHLQELNKYKFGRSNEVEFHVEEISVSRAHGEIIISHNKVMIKDYKSKFGTQILNKSSFTLNKVDITQNTFQIGRTWFMLSYHSPSKTNWLFSWCWRKRSSSKQEVEETKIDLNGAHFLNKNLVTELENNIENLQKKDRDSVFNLDEDFYNRLLSINLNKDNYNDRRQSTRLGHGNETVDEDK